MSKAINIGKIIYGTIQNDSTLAAALGTRVFPIIAESETAFPFITYTRQNVWVQNQSKDGWFGDEVQFNIQVCDSEYMRSCTIADLIRNSFENKVISNDELTIKNIRMTGISEMWNEETYIQSLNFSCSAE